MPQQGETQRAVRVWMSKNLHLRYGGQAEMAKLLGVSRSRIGQLITKIEQEQQGGLHTEL